MNLYLRLLKLALQLIFGQKSMSLDTTVMTFRAWPHDCDFNMHMTNARYLAMMDLGRTQLLGKAGVLGAIIKKKWMPVANAIEITYIREIKPFQRFTLHSRLLAWDEKYWYIEQKFMRGEKLLALTMVRGLFLKGRRKVAFDEVAALLDTPPMRPEMPGRVTAWKNLLQEKRKASLDEEATLSQKK